jgi:hypothetical protein
MAEQAESVTTELDQIGNGSVVPGEQVVLPLMLHMAAEMAVVAEMEP